MSYSPEYIPKGNIYIVSIRNKYFEIYRLLFVNLMM